MIEIRDPCECLRCGFTWMARIAKPRACPCCKSYRWDTAPAVKGGVDVPKFDEPDFAGKAAGATGKRGTASGVK